MKRLRASVPALVKNHKGDIISILSTLEGVSPEDYAGSLDLLKLMKDFIDLLTDEAFMALFT